MSLGFHTKGSASVHGQMKLARLLEMPEREVSDRVRELEADPLFKRLHEAGVVSFSPFSEARFTARRFGGWGVKTSSEGLGDLIDGQGEIVLLIQRVGQERFEEFFLNDEGRSDAQRAQACGVSLKEAGRLREFVDRVYIRAEFESPAEQAAPAKVFSAVAGIAVEDGKPILSFFHRDIWSKRYGVDERRREELLRGLPPKEARKADKLLRELDFLDRRKTTLYRVLETVLSTQADFLVSGDPEKRRPLTQKDLSDRLDISPSVLNRLISNKSVELPWGLEAAMNVFVPSRKSMMLGRLQELALSDPEMSDERLREKMAELHGVTLSRRSVAQYRKELGLGGRGQRKSM